MDQDQVVDSGSLSTPAEKLRIKPKPVLEDVDRITATFSMQHEHCCTDPEPVPASFTEVLETVEQPYKRVVKIKQEPIPLDLGWLAEGAGKIVIRNMTGIRRNLQPSEEEKAAIAKCVVVVFPRGTDPSKTGRVIKPGQFDFGEPTCANELMMYCKSGIAEVVLNIIPR